MTGSEKLLFDKLYTVLKNVEEMKILLFQELKRDDKLNALFKNHITSLNKLFEILLGTEEDHKLYKESLELAESYVNLLKKDFNISHIQRSDLYESSNLPEEIDILYDRIFIDEEVTTKDLADIEFYIKKYKDNPFIIGLKAHILSILESPDNALSFIDDYLEIFKESSWLWFMRGFHLPISESEQKFMSYENAMKYISDNITINKHLITMSWSHDYYDMNQLENALDKISESINYNLSCYLAWSIKAFILNDMNKIVEAIGCIENSIVINDKYSESWLIKGDILHNLGEKFYDETLTCYDKAISFNPEIPDSYYNKALILMKMNKYDEAIKLFNIFLKLEPKEPCAWCNIGICLNNIHKYEEAFEAFNTASQMDLDKTIVKNCSHLFICKAINLVALDKVAEAIEIAEIAVKRNPKDEFSKKWLKDILEEEKTRASES